MRNRVQLKIQEFRRIKRRINKMRDHGREIINTTKKDLNWVRPDPLAVVEGAESEDSSEDKEPCIPEKGPNTVIPMSDYDRYIKKFRETLASSDDVSQD